MLGISSWVWIGGAAALVAAAGLLVAVALGLFARVKELNRGFRASSGRVNEMLGEMRVDLEQASEGLAALRRAPEDDAGGPPS